MNKFPILYLAVIILFAITSSAQAQNTYKKARKEVKSRPIKDARKEARKWTKQGFTNLPGDAPLAGQFEQSMVKQYLLDENGNNQYITAYGTALAGTEGVASAHALDNARIELAGQIQVEVSALVSNNKANAQYNVQEVETIDEFLSNSKTLIQHELGMIEPVIRMYKVTADKNVEYRYTVMYHMTEARKMAKNLIQKELKGKLEANEADLDKLLGL